MSKRWLKVSVAGSALLASLVSGSNASAGFEPDFENWVYSFYDDGWTDWAPIWDPTDGFPLDPGFDPSALLVAIPATSFTDLLELGCIEMPPVQGDGYDLSFTIDANECLILGDASTVETMVDEDSFPLAGFIWVAIEDGQAVEFDCLDARGRVSTNGDINADIVFSEGFFGAGSVSEVLSSAGNIEDMMRSMSRIGSDRVSLFDVSQVAALLVSESAGDLDDVDPEEDAVWTVNMEFSACSNGGWTSGLGLDHYRGRAEQGQLPNTH